ncbi:MAG: NAD-dependent protein deacetylase [Fibrella sp.]|nr:NAD-dependent protein deacetylase [Armatimonadota bacterium]
MLQQAADAIRDADALLICAGAGIGVDSGLPDFRGDDGFWEAYPPLRDAGIPFTQIASPEMFYENPALAWGFYGHRLNLYRATVPHPGFSLLKQWAGAKPFGSFVFTSNVDGQFQKADFDAGRIAECHGSIHHLQCLYGCSWEIWSADDDAVVVDTATLRASGKLPHCPNCLQIARPNVLMFNDWRWQHTRSEAQERELESWLTQVLGNHGKIAVVEIGAGRAIPTVRLLAERVADATAATLIRINPRDCALPARGVCVGLPFGSLDALTRIAALV